MFRPNLIRLNPRLELEIAGFILIILCAVYVAYDWLAEPAGGQPFGHWLGIVGTLLMVMTETLYSLRKRTRLLNRWGPVRNWLSFHIVTGLVGPFLVTMHTGLQFRGLAGVTFGLTAVVVASGFIGRYLYTALNRAIGGSAINQEQALRNQQALQAELDRFEEDKPRRISALTQTLDSRYGPGRLARWRYRWQLRRGLRGLEKTALDYRRQIADLHALGRRFERRGQRIDRTRRLFQIWHMLHIPLGLALFVSVAIHIVAALFFRAGIFH